MAVIEYDTETKQRRVVSTRKLPVITLEGKSRNVRDYDLAELMAMFLPSRSLYCIEENVPMQSDGLWSVASTAKGFGTMRGILYALRCNTLYVHPRTWQAKIFPRPSDRAVNKTTKDLAKDYVVKNYPTAQITGPRGGFLDGITDAVCIADYGLTQLLHARKQGKQ